MTDTGTDSGVAQESARSGDNRRRRSGAVEAVVGLLGGLLVVAALAFLTYEAVAVRDSPPTLDTTITRVEPGVDQFTAHFTVVNLGGTTAESVQVVGQLSCDGETVQQVSAVVPYVPPNSNRSGALIFTEGSPCGKLTVWSSGYRLP